MDLIWVLCNGQYCSFWNVDLNNSHFDNMEGIYIIWFNSETIYVGQGIIRDRIAAHRIERDFEGYKNYDLRVTWASVAKSYRDGIEAYLAYKLKPKLGLVHPNVPPIAVNLPW